MEKIKAIIEKLKSTERGRAILRLSGYMVFFLFILMLISISNVMSPSSNRIDEETVNKTLDNDTSKVETSSLSYMEKQEKLLTGEYTFTFKITGETEVTYSGTFSKGNINGFKETLKETYRYIIEDGITYKQTLNDREEIDDLYFGLDENLFDFKSLFSKLNSKNTIIDRQDEIKKYIYKEIENCDYEITTDENSITKIVVVTDGLNYEFTFKY